MTYDNNVRKRSCQSKVRYHKRSQSPDWRQKKWYVSSGIGRKSSNMLPPGKMIDSDLYYQLMRLKRSIQEVNSGK